MRLFIFTLRCICIAGCHQLWKIQAKVPAKYKRLGLMPTDKNMLDLWDHRSLFYLSSNYRCFIHTIPACIHKLLPFPHNPLWHSSMSVWWYLHTQLNKFDSFLSVTLQISRLHFIITKTFAFFLALNGFRNQTDTSDCFNWPLTNTHPLFSFIFSVIQTILINVSFSVSFTCHLSFWTATTYLV